MQQNHEERLLGEYLVTRVLGKGGFGDVYLGEHLSEKVPVAIKVLHEPLTNENIKGFVTEVGTQQRLRHDHIVRLLDYGIGANQLPFLVMEYAPGGSLADRHPPGSQLLLESIVSYLKPLSAALQYAHDSGVIHRDIKPANFLMGTNGKVLLGDFGIVAIALSTRSRERQRETQKVVGSWEYAAPEQFVGKAVPASDQYSLAVVVYEWLCGERPFHGNFDQLVVQHYHLKSPPPPFHEKMSISPKVEQVIMKALAKEPKDRFALVTDFATALQKASAAPLLTQASNSSSVQPTQTPITPTVPAWLTRRDAGGTATALPPLPMRQVAQPVVPKRSRAAMAAAPILDTPTPRPSMPRKSWPYALARRLPLRNIGVLLSILIDALENLAQKLGYLGNTRVLLVVLILVIGLPGYFAFSNYISASQTAINSSFSDNSSYPRQPPITSVLIFKTVRFSGVNITIATAQQSKMFLDDSSSATTGIVRVNLKEDNTSNSSTKYLYSEEARLILPNKTSVAPNSELYFSGPDAGVTRTNWLDFPVPESFQISQLTLQLGRDTKTQEIIPLKGKKV